MPKRPSRVQDGTNRYRCPPAGQPPASVERKKAFQDGAFIGWATDGSSRGRSRQPRREWRHRFGTNASRLWATTTAWS
jgi:hypothetical protein